MTEDKLLLLAEAATPGPWRSMRQGNQRIGTSYMPAAKVVGASVVEPLVRPWNPAAYVAFGMNALTHEEARFLDADADFIAAANPTNVRALLARIARLRAIVVTVRDVVADCGAPQTLRELDDLLARDASDSPLEVP